MSAELLNAIKRQVAAQLDQLAQPSWGIVSGVDPNRPAVKVRKQPEDVETGWLPILQQAAAGGWGVYTLPTLGMVAKIVPDSGIAGHWVVIGFAHNDRALPPKTPNSIGSGGVRSTGGVVATGGETVITHASGAFIRLTAGGAIILSAPTVQIDGNLRVNGNIVADLDISDLAGVHNTVAGLRAAYNGHVHAQDPDSRGDTEVPTHTTSIPVT
jgi:phage baseplate assembly protein gpV